MNNWFAPKGIRPLLALADQDVNGGATSKEYAMADFEKVVLAVFCDAASGSDAMTITLQEGADGAWADLATSEAYFIQKTDCGNYGEADLKKVDCSRTAPVAAAGEAVVVGEEEVYFIVVDPQILSNGKTEIRVKVEAAASRNASVVLLGEVFHAMPTNG